NQLELLEALAGVPVPLVLAGDPNPSHGGYARAVARVVAARPDTYHLPALSRPLIASAMAAARVHALPSWVENVGLASLEAAAAGAAVVSTSRGHLREYLGDDARYCEPGDPDGLRTAVVDALAGGRRDASRAAIAGRFTWDRAAALLLAVYDEALGRRPAPPS
ncbi:MAG: glycosyltransferase, partial [Candidatus Wallbacteria bacterium]|nr:glycosyltransferase [Candidatus Wallbacteria bacterium]